MWPLIPEHWIRFEEPILKGNIKMRYLTLLTVFLAITMAHAFTGMIFTPKANYKSTATPIATIKTKLLHKCWVSPLNYP